MSHLQVNGSGAFKSSKNILLDDPREPSLGLASDTYVGWGNGAT